jgi:hypothetical protein
MSQRKSAKRCFVYGGERSSNSYRLNPEFSFFHERLQWLWIQVHQVEKPKINGLVLPIAFSTNLRPVRRWIGLN